MEILIEIGKFLLSFLFVAVAIGMVKATVIDMDKENPPLAIFFMLMYAGIIYWLFFKLLLGH